MGEEKFDLKTFIDNYYPDNHWLSKSMEIMKQGYGTYWYLKKMLVYYYYIFINKKLGNKEFKQINNIFITYIKSLPISIQAEARNFFYVIDFYDASFISFNEFISTTESFDDYESELLKARKYYYSYVMNLKGQNNKKAKILDIVIEERNYFKGINKARSIIVDNFVQLSNDVHGFLRNERQILFLMGLLNYTENRGVEEYAPTEVGLMALFANNEELILLMELQKIKQVSRNPLVFYGYNPERQRNRQMKEGLDSSLGEGVAIKTHPYFFLLKFLKEKGHVDMEKYRYFLARVNDNHKENELFSINCDNIKIIKNAVRKKDAEYINPGINGNVNDVIGQEDFGKELKKYLAGVFLYPKDIEHNIVSVGRYSTQKCSVTEKEKLKKIINGYSKAIDYIDKQYKDLFNNVNQMHRRKYLCHISKQKFNEKDKDQISLFNDWLVYFISIDPQLLFILTKSVMKANNMNKRDFFITFPTFCKRIFGWKNISSCNLSLDILNDNRYNYDTESNIVIPYQITQEHLLAESKKYLEVKNSIEEERKRNTSLIYMYQAWRKQNNYTCCEICGCELEMKTNGDLIYDVHHIIPFNENSAFGPDHYLNIIAGCPNCHAKIHAKVSLYERQQMYGNIAINSDLRMSIKERMLQMYKSNYLFSTSFIYAISRGMITEEEKNTIVFEEKDE